MSTTPLVSVIIPCYNYGHLISETIESVINQTYSNWECIIVDDGSSDNTREVVQAFLSSDPRIHYIYQSNKGLAGARNTGLRVSKGDYIQLLDADDILPRQKIEVHINFLEKNSSTDLVFSDVYMFEKTLSNLGSAVKLILKAKSLSGKGEVIIDNLLDDNMFLVHCALFRAPIISDIGYFNEKMITCEDWNFWFRMAVVGKQFYYMDNPESKVYVRNHGVNMSKNRKNMWIGRLFFYGEAKKILQNHVNISSAVQKKNTAHLIILTVRYELAFGNLLIGLFKIPSAILQTKKPYYVLYDSLYWIKERVLNRL